MLGVLRGLDHAHDEFEELGLCRWLDWLLPLFSTKRVDDCFDLVLHIFPLLPDITWPHHEKRVVEFRFMKVVLRLHTTVSVWANSVVGHGL